MTALKIPMLARRVMPTGIYAWSTERLFDEMLRYMEKKGLSDCHIFNGRVHPYCLECHAGVCNIREALRKRGENQWPDELMWRVEACA